MYVWSILFPPIAVLMCKKPWQACLNVIFLCFFYLPAVIHALLLVSEYKKDERMERQVKLMKQQY